MFGLEEGNAKIEKLCDCDYRVCKPSSIARRVRSFQLQIKSTRQHYSPTPTPRARALAAIGLRLVIQCGALNCIIVRHERRLTRLRHAYRLAHMAPPLPTALVFGSLNSP
jgi:hypothetical protein